MEAPRTFKEIMADAVKQAQQEKAAELQRLLPKPVPQEKTAAASIDVADPKVAHELAKVGFELANSLQKRAEEATATQASTTGGPSQSPPQTTLSSPGKTPDLSPGTNEFTSRDSKAKPGEGSLTPGTTNPSQVMLDKSSALRAASIAIHSRYSKAAADLRAAKVADQPMGGVSEGGEISAAKPEGRPDASGTDGGPKPPTSPEGVAAFTNLDADAQHRADMPEGVSSAMLSAAKDDPPMAHAQAGASEVTKAAAMRALLGTFGPGTKLGMTMRNRLAGMKTADPLPAISTVVNRPLGDMVQATTGPGMPPPATDPRLTGALLSDALPTGGGGKSAPMDLTQANQTTSGQPMVGGPKGMGLQTTGDAIVKAQTAPGVSPLTSAPLGGGANVGSVGGPTDPYSVANSGV